MGKYLEIDFVYYGLSLVRLNNLDEQLLFLINNARGMKSWAITDFMSTYIKKMSFDKYEEFFFKMYNSSYTYDRRMAYILGLKQYKRIHGNDE